MPSILLIAFGNQSRRDDGVAFHIVARLRERLGIPWDFDELAEDLEHEPAIICLHQLAPELAETLQQYESVVFLDAHVPDTNWDLVAWQQIEPALKASMVTHQLKPTTLLALCNTLYGRCPQSYTLSVVGYDFDFGEELSADTSRLADQAVDLLQQFIER